MQNGTSLYDLKTLGGWATIRMVERYAHMTHERVAKVSGNIDGMWQKSGKLGLETGTNNWPESHASIGRRNWIRTNDPHHVKVVL